ncbi:hypothetical protein M9H77_02812 [Catharanthus roseus]|uniref:Uncharacterized protein n=1 Tax=Catharanthus roseus TaxID=4058 RepID=A0ACC0C9W4_CATRO|nr:hypothetical protein M9H77_02812 [Catharanthus roseus]
MKVGKLILEILQVLLHLKNRDSALVTRGEGEVILVLSVRRGCSLSSHSGFVRQASHTLVDHTDPQCLSEFFESHGIEGLSEDIS